MDSLHLRQDILLDRLEHDIQQGRAFLAGLNEQAGNNPGQLQRCLISATFRKIECIEEQIQHLKDTII